MVKVTFYPAQELVEVEEGVTILQAARQGGVVIEAPCNGSGTCGKCKVKVNPEDLKNVIAKDIHHLSHKETEEGWVLSCETDVYGDISVAIIDNTQNKKLQILSFGKSFNFQLDSYIRKAYLPESNQTQIYGGEGLLGTEAGDTANQLHGVVVDIGTTTLVTSLVDLKTGEEIASASALNPQSIHGQDVLSRIKFASEEDGLKIMFSELTKELNRMIGEITEKKQVSPQHIYEIVYSGNTCMLHLATNSNPYSLGKFPYTPQVTGGSYLSAREYGLNISDYGLIYLPPIISAYVGPDITSGVLASELAKLRGVTLLVDIGTNGEMVIGVNGQLAATSTAAGPAFEGMNITYGMRAGIGAIEYFQVAEDGLINIKTIGETEAVGICGSGLLDIVGELVEHKVIKPNGRFAKADDASIAPSLREKLVHQDGKIVFQVTDKVFLTQKDVRQVQLAKGAVRAGIEFLLKDRGIEAQDVDKVLIAGSFGYHLRAKSLVNIGLLPVEFAKKIDFIGNTSKSGGQAFLLNQGFRQTMKQQVLGVEVLELANYKDFDKVFINCLNF